MPSVLLMLMLLLPAMPAVAADVPATLPPAACSAIEPCRMVGKGRLRWWGFHVYDASLWAREGRWDAGAPHVLDIVYARSITAAQLADTSVDEIRRLGFRDEAWLARWGAQLRGVFTDVQPGSRLTGIHRPQQGAQFYAGSRLLGSIDDPELARRFFDIWLDPRTQKPDLRAALLGGHGDAR